MSRLLLSSSYHCSPPRTLTGTNVLPAHLLFVLSYRRSSLECEQFERGIRGARARRPNVRRLCALRDLLPIVLLELSTDNRVELPFLVVDGFGKLKVLALLTFPQATVLLEQFSTKRRLLWFRAVPAQQMEGCWMGLCSMRYNFDGNTSSYAAETDASVIGNLGVRQVSRSFRHLCGSLS